MWIVHNFHPDETIKFVAFGEKNEERLIFSVFGEYNKFEEKKLNELEEYLQENDITLSSFFDDSERLRFLQANQYKIKQSVENMVEHQEFRAEKLPYKLTTDMKE